MPTVNSLISEKIDRLGISLHEQMSEMKSDLGSRISDLTEKVNLQNGRVGKSELAIQKIQVQHSFDNSTTRLDRRQMAVIGTGGMVSGAALIELIKWTMTVVLK